MDSLLVPKEGWSPDWELCEHGQVDIFLGDGNWHSTFPVLQRCRTEDGNWLYMAVTPDGEQGQGVVALALEHVSKKKGGES